MMVARPGEVAPPNGFFFWEFLLAAMSRLARLDCLEFSLRSRWLIPLLGLSGLYALTFELARSKRRTSLIISIVAIAILTTFLFRPPDDFQAIVNSGNHGRIITAFMGSIHHADTAMEILLPLMLAAFFRLRRSQDLPRLIVFALFILMSFFWHPRELFQTAWIAAMMMVTDLILQRRQVFWRLLKKVYAPAFAAYGIVVAALAAAVRFFAVGSADTGRELANKAALLGTTLREMHDWQFWTRLELPFIYHFHGVQPQIDLVPENVHLTAHWMLAVLLGCLLLKRSRWLHQFLSFVCVMWFLTLCWGPTQSVLGVATFSEILTSKSRFLFPWMVILLGAVWMELIDRCARAVRPAALLAGAIAAGCAFQQIFAWSQTHKISAGIIFSVLGFALCLASLARGLIQKAFARTRLLRLTSPTAFLPLAAFVLFLAPFSSREAAAFWKTGLRWKRDIPAATATGDAMNLSKEMTRFLQTQVEPRTYWLVRNSGSAEAIEMPMLEVLAPIYQMPLRGNVIVDMGVVRSKDPQAIPFYNPVLRAGAVDEAMIRFLRQHKVNYVFLQGAYAEKFDVGWRSNSVKCVFANPAAREAVLQLAAQD